MPNWHRIAKGLRTCQNKEGRKAISEIEVRTSELLFLYMSWRIVFIEESEHLNLYLDNIKVKRGDDEIVLPLSDIHTLIVDNYKTNISVNLINKCSEYNINLLLCGIDHMPQSILLPFVGHHQSALMLKKQIEWSTELKENLHREIIKHKINNQANLLIYLNKDKSVIERIKLFESEVFPGDVTNREGLSAKMYFRELYGVTFKRFTEDIVNAGLNYGYSILRSQITKSLLAKGLNTSLGIFHIGATNNFNLSDDFIEPFRPLIDNWVYHHLLNEKNFTRDHRIALIKITTSSLYFDKKKQTLFNVMNLYVDNILNFVENGDTQCIQQPILIYDSV
jgi:CRISPR-associated protein Cas1